MRIVCWQTILMKHHSLFFWKLEKMLQNLLSAASWYALLRVKILLKYLCIQIQVNWTYFSWWIIYTSGRLKWAATIIKLTWIYWATNIAVTMVTNQTSTILLNCWLMDCRARGITMAKWWNLTHINLYKRKNKVIQCSTIGLAFDLSPKPHWLLSSTLYIHCPLVSLQLWVFWEYCFFEIANDFYDAGLRTS